MAAIQSQATEQLGAIPFQSLIGGPLNAAVEAQAQAANTSVEFIKAVAIKDNGEIRNVVFSYQKDGSTVELAVPVLTIVPIPYLRIDDMTIAFKAKISAETTTADTTNSSINKSTNGSAGAGWGWGKSSFKAGYSSKKDSSSSRDSKYSVEYTMDISIKAVQDDMPAGLEKVLNILEKSIEAAPPAASPHYVNFGDIRPDDNDNKKIKIEVNLFDTNYDQVTGSYPVKCAVEGLPGIIHVDTTGSGDFKPISKWKSTDGGTAEFRYELNEPMNEGDKLTITASCGDAVSTTEFVKTASGPNPI